MNDDAELLRRYAETRSDTAFAALVQRHLDLVYSAALRRLGGDAHHAADVAQIVFLSLARHAATLARRPVLTGWLYTATRNAALDLIRAGQRRRIREQHAHAMETTHASDAPSADWERLRLVLDGAIDQLAERDREILLLRFFEDHSFAEVGARLCLSEDAARMRTARALEKLRHSLAGRGVASTAAALGLALAGQTVAAAPAGLAAVVTSSVLAGVSSVGIATVATGFSSFMFTTKSILAVAGTLVAVAAGTAVYEARLAGKSLRTADDLLRERDAWRARSATLEARAGELSDGLARAAAFQKKSDTRLAKTGAPPPVAVVSGRQQPWDDPDYGRSFVALDKASLGLRFGMLYRALKLSPGQISKFENAQVEFRQSLADIWSEAAAQGLPINDTSVARLTVEPNRALETSLRAVLGDSGYEQYRQYEKAKPARDLVASLAGNVYFSEAPLTAGQGDELTRILQANTEMKNTPMRDDGKSAMYALREETNWEAVDAQARGLLTPAQIVAFKALVEQKRLQSDLQRVSNPPLK